MVVAVVGIDVVAVEDALDVDVNVKVVEIKMHGLLSQNLVV